MALSRRCGLSNWKAACSGDPVPAPACCAVGAGGSTDPGLLLHRPEHLHAWSKCWSPGLLPGFTLDIRSGGAGCAVPGQAQPLHLPAVSPWAVSRCLCRRSLPWSSFRKEGASAGAWVAQSSPLCTPNLGSLSRPLPQAAGPTASTSQPPVSPVPAPVLCVCHLSCPQAECPSRMGSSLLVSDPHPSSDLGHPSAGLPGRSPRY